MSLYDWLNKADDSERDDPREAVELCAVTDCADKGEYACDGCERLVCHDHIHVARDAQLCEGCYKAPGAMLVEELRDIFRYRGRDEL